MSKIKKCFNWLSGLYYHNKILRLLDSEKLNDAICCAINSGVFTDVTEHQFNGSETKFYIGETDNITKDISLKTRYVFHKNLCLVSEHSKRNTIIRIVLREPNVDWKIDVSPLSNNLIFFPDNDAYYEVFTWWNVDWLNTGHRDVGSNYVDGAWNKTLVTQIEELFSVIKNSTASKKFDSKFKNV